MTVNPAIADLDREVDRDLVRLGLGPSLEEQVDAENAPMPLPSALLPVLAVPGGALPEKFEDWVRDVAERSNCPPDYVALPMLVGAGMLLARHCVLRPKRCDTWAATPNIWGAIVGPPGTLKSPALKAGLMPLDRFEQDARAAYLDARKSFTVEQTAARLRAEEMEKTARKALSKDLGGNIEHLIQTEEVAPPPEERFLVSDSTVEKLGEILASNPGGVAFVRDELSALFSTLSREEQAPARGFLLTAWDGGRYRWDRIGRGTVDVPFARVALVGGIQPGPLSMLVRNASGTGDDGLIQRPLYVWPDLSTVQWQDVDRFPNRQARDAFLEAFDRIRRTPPSGLQQDTYPDGSPDGLPFLRLDDQALELFLEWRGQLERTLADPETPDGLRAALAKYRKHTPALALICHCVDYGGGPVNASSMSKALALSEYFESHTRRVFDSSRRPVIEAAHAVLRRLKRGDLEAGGFTAREVMRPQWSHLTDRAVVADALAMLVDHRHTRMFTRETGGRPSEFYVWRGAA